MDEREKTKLTGLGEYKFFSEEDVETPVDAPDFGLGEDEKGEGE